MVEFCTDYGYTPGTPAQTAEFMRGEERLWWPVVQRVEAENDKPGK